MRFDSDGVLIFVVLASVIAFVGIVFVLGMIMRHLVRPAHDRLWKHEKLKRKDYRNLFLDGMFLLIMILWIPLMVVLTYGGFYIAVSSIIEGNLVNSILGFALTSLFGTKLFLMLEHRIHAEKRWKEKRRKEKTR